jgi:protocatechuate 4,5-dioxygenase beta chain
MARIVGSICTSHVPAIGRALADGRQNDHYWKPFFEGFEGVHAWLEEARPDAAIVFYNDHGLQFFLDRMPTFAVGAAAEYPNADEGWGIPVLAPFRGDPELSWHVIESLIADEFDIVSCQELRVDHAVALPMALLWPDRAKHSVPIVPIDINTVQHPLPSAQRCFKLGQAVARAVESYPADLRVVMVGTGGLSHQLDGQRAGFINKEFDLMCLDRLVEDPEALTRYSNRELVALAGTQGVEILMWIAARGALPGRVSKVHSHYHIPISNTASGVLVLQNEPPAAPARLLRTA